MTGITLSSATATSVEILKHFHGTNLVVSGAPAVIQRYDVVPHYFCAVFTLLTYKYVFFPGCGVGAALGGTSS